MSWLKSHFNSDKPIIAMCHLRALPGDPGYDPDHGMDWTHIQLKTNLINCGA